MRTLAAIVFALSLTGTSAFASAGGMTFLLPTLSYATDATAPAKASVPEVSRDATPARAAPLVVPHPRRAPRH